MTCALVHLNARKFCVCIYARVCPRRIHNRWTVRESGIHSVTEISKKKKKNMDKSARSSRIYPWGRLSIFAHTMNAIEKIQSTEIGKLFLGLSLNIKKQQNACIFNFFISYPSFMASLIYHHKTLYRCVTRNWSSHSKWMEQSIYP